MFETRRGEAAKYCGARLLQLTHHAAFGSVLQPNVCVLLDVGTMPRPKSIYHLWKAFDINSNVAGACGEVSRPSQK